MPNKHALIVGVDQYSKLEARYQLGGCVNDAKLMRSVLIDRFGFEPQHITELHDEAASQAAILEAMAQLADAIDQDDVVVFHFSGHGSRRTTANPEKASGKDSTIMPSDSGRRPDPNLDIIDDQIYAWLEKLAEKTNYITLTFDCCHSGTITRDVFAGAVRGVEEDSRSLEDMGVDPEALPKRTSVATRSTSAGGWLGQSDSYVVISGCREDEKSNEYSRDDGAEPSRNGALTFSLTQALLQAQPDSTYRDVFEVAYRGVSTQFSKQHPQIEGQLDRQVLGIKDIEPMRYVSLTALEGNQATLAGGAAHGLRPGGRWAVYPVGAKSVQGAQQQGLIEINSVGALTSTGHLLDDNGGIEVGARCVELARPAEQPLHVDLSALDAEAAQQLSTAFDNSNLLRPAQSADAADVRAYLIASRKTVTETDPAPQMGATTEPLWVFIGADGEQVMQSHPAIGEAAMPGICGDLEIVANYRNGLNIENPQNTMDVVFNIYQELPNGEWQLANGGTSTFKHGDSIAIEIVNRMKIPVFASILQFSIDKEISLLYPPNKDGERIEAEKSLVFGREKRRIRLQMPQSDEIVAGQETLKAFISTESADFTWLLQSGSYDPKNRLRAAVIDEEPEEDTADWTTISRTYELVR
ncbi:MAG: caspase family protein [Pseudomonadales bacterium]